MVKIELIPDLTHCIETAAKREYEAVLKQLLKPRQRNKQMEEKLEILMLFLETADFKKLRSKYEKQLIGGRKVVFEVYLVDGVPKHEMRIT